MNKVKSYKKMISSLFGRTAKTYGSDYFNYFAKNLVIFANQLSPISPKTKILDVATGRGAIIKQFSSKWNGSITGIDLSSQMINETKKDLKDYPNVRLLTMDAENIAFEEFYFDALFCGFGIFFMPDMKRALNEFYRVLKKGGFIAISIWGKSDLIHEMLKNLISQYSDYVSIRAHNFSDPHEIIKILKEIGFESIATKKDSFEQVYTSFENWWDSLWTHGTRFSLEQLSTDQLKDLKNQLKEKLLKEVHIHMKPTIFLAKKLDFFIKNIILESLKISMWLFYIFTFIRI